MTGDRLVPFWAVGDRLKFPRSQWYRTANDGLVRDMPDGKEQRYRYVKFSAVLECAALTHFRMIGFRRGRASLIVQDLLNGKSSYVLSEGGVVAVIDMSEFLNRVQKTFDDLYEEQGIFSGGHSL